MTFDWALLQQPTPLAVLRGQLEFSWLVVSERLHDLGDVEYRWEPTPDAWSVRPVGDGRSPQPIGVGDWRLDNAQDEPDPAPMRTIAWLVGHLTDVFVERQESAFGRRDARPVAFAGTAGEGVAALSSAVDAWRSSLESLDSDQLWTVGLSQATAVDADSPFAHVAAHVNRELIHHGSEITVLRDLYGHSMAGAR